MNRSGAWIALSVAALCIKLLILAGKSRPKYDTFDTYKPYGSYGSTYDPLKYQAATKQQLALDSALAETVERHCQAFQSAELTEVMRRSAEVNTAGAVDVLDQALVLGELDAHGGSITEGFVTTRSWDDAKGSTVYVDADSLDPQWVGRADHVQVGVTTLDWNGFVKTAGSKLKPVMADGAVVPDVYALEAGFHVPALASYR